MRIFQVDAFADRPFGGNPAGVCVVSADADPTWMQSVANEMNLSETAFLSPLGEGRHELRWFTPAVEVDLCGHATLAAAHVLWEQGSPEELLEFETRSGVLTAIRVGDGLIQLDFPADPPAPIDPSSEPSGGTAGDSGAAGSSGGAAELGRTAGDGGAAGSSGGAAELGRTAGLAEALGASVVGLHRGRFDVLAEVADAETVRCLAPDLRALAAIRVRGVIVTAAGDGHDGADFVSRCFYPAAGVDEDPVTGSAHCTLASFWCPRLARSSLVGWQASARGGRIGVELAGDRVLLTGRAITVLRGELV